MLPQGPQGHSLRFLAAKPGALLAVFAQGPLGGSMPRQTHCSQVVKKKHRTRMLEFFIDVARECFNIGNFNSMMAIICECSGTGGAACASPCSDLCPMSPPQLA